MEKNKFATLAINDAIASAKKSLEEHGLTVFVTETGKEAKEKALSLIPKNAEIMTSASTTLEQLDILPTINDSGDYDSIKARLLKMDRNTQGSEMQKLGAAPEYVIGSVHAVTEDGKVVVASGTGSQLPSYSYGAQHVIWMVSTKKIVKNLDEALDRLYTHVLPQEDARIKKIYGPEHSSHVNKLFILNNEGNKERITLIFVKEDLGF